MSRAVRDGMASGLAAVLAPFGGIARATQRAAPWTDTLPALVITQPVDTFDTIFAGSGVPVFGQLGGPGSSNTPCTYVWWLLFAVLDPDADQSVIDASDTLLDQVVEALKGYLQSLAGQCTGTLTQAIRPVRIDRSDEGATITYHEQQFWGAKITLSVYENDVAGTS